MKFIKVNVIVLTIFFSVGVRANFYGTVTRVIDGDTVDMVTHDHKLIRVRLADIDAPERTQPYFNKSRQALRELISGKVVYVIDGGLDRYNRVLGTIIYQHININEEMVRTGMAWAYQYKNKVTNMNMGLIEKEARDSKTGLWKSVEPLEPWLFRYKK